MSQRKLVSIIILAWNQLKYTQMCIDSIRSNTNVPYELILVNNGSTDGTLNYFNSIQGAVIIDNKENLGFAKGNNQAMQRARGDYLLLLNNDILVGRGWLEGLVDCMESDDQIGLVGPLSNCAINGQQIRQDYLNIQQFPSFADSWMRTYRSSYRDTNFLVGFCLLIKRSLYEKIGGLDETFEIGSYEDNDYCRRAIEAGYKLKIAADVYIHHFGNITFQGNKLNMREINQRNEKIFAEKWRNRN